MAKRDIILIGGSAGSSEPLRKIVAELPSDFRGSTFITTHIPSTHETYLPRLLGGLTSLSVHEAMDGQPIQPGHVYVAPADKHLLLINSTIRLGLGPREHMVRPSIDPMFRSAALAYGPRAVGIVLSGLMNDGASGLFAIKQAGGTAVVQHPLDAVQGDMPRAALEATVVDHVAVAAEIPRILIETAKLDAGPAKPAPESLIFEVEVAAGGRLGSDQLRRFADPAALTCPDCGGVLSEVRDQAPLRYRCQIGHAYTGEELVARNEPVDQAVRVALRVMEERVELVERMARDARRSGRSAVAELYEKRALEYGGYADTLRKAAILSLRMTRELSEQVP